VKVLHPTPPRAGGGGQQLLLAEAVMTMTARPAQHQVETIASMQLMDGAHRPQRPIAANMQVEIWPTRCLHGQAARSPVR